MSFNVKLARQKLHGLSMTDKIELAHLALDEIEALQAQLAARNQAAEAMGVLERLVKHQGSTHVTLYHNDSLRIFGVETREDEGLCDYRGNSLIEAVLMAGGEG